MNEIEIQLLFNSSDTVKTMAYFPPQKYSEIWPGKNRFYCGGRCMSANNISVLCLSFWLIVIVSALFFAFDCRLLLKKSVLILIVGIILFIIVLSTLLKTALTDPGIIPRANAQEAEWIEKQIAANIIKLHSGNEDNNVQVTAQMRTKEVKINGTTFNLKFCQTCRIFRPPRASHCSSCNNCVDRFDHHCPWVGNCIGRRNYRYFYFFNLSLTIYCLYIIAVAITNIAFLSVEGDGIVHALKISPTSILVVIVAFISFMSVVGLSGYHCALMCQEISTNEDIKGFQKHRKNPHSKGSMCRNFCWLTYGPRPPSTIRALDDVEASYLPIGCSYRGPDGCLTGPVGPGKSAKSFIDDHFAKSGPVPSNIADAANADAGQVIVDDIVPPGPSELQHVNYPRQSYRRPDSSVTNNRTTTSNGLVSPDPPTQSSYGTMQP